MLCDTIRQSWRRARCIAHSRPQVNGGCDGSGLRRGSLDTWAPPVGFPRESEARSNQRLAPPPGDAQPAPEGLGPVPAPPVSGLKKRESPAQTRVPQWGTRPSKARIRFQHSHLVYTRALPGPTPFVTRSAPRPRGAGAAGGGRKQDARGWPRSARKTAGGPRP